MLIGTKLAPGFTAQESVWVCVAKLFVGGLKREVAKRVAAHKQRGQWDAELTSKLTKSERFASAQVADGRQNITTERRAIRERPNHRRRA